MNKVLLAGRLGGDAKVHTSGEGEDKKSLVTMSLATSEYVGKDKDGKAKYEPEWHNLVSFQPGLVALAEKGSLIKGTLITIEGKNRTREYEKDGNKLRSHQVVINGLDILLRAKSNGDAKVGAEKGEPSLATATAEGEPF